MRPVWKYKREIFFGWTNTGEKLPRIMKVLCTANSGEKLAPKHFAVGYSTSSIFHISLGAEYVVYGIALWRGLLSYLIVGAYDRPVFYPSDLFEVRDSRLSPGWHFAFFGQNDETWVNAVWGYPELTDPQYYDQLVNLDENALQTFQKRRQEMDESG